MKTRNTKTDYRARYKLLKSGIPRLVIRKTDHYIIYMIVEYGEKGDKTLVHMTSKTLAKYGWDLGFKNLPAAYLGGYLVAKRSGVKEAIVDKGIRTLSKNSFVFYCIKGAVDGGMNLHVKEINVDEDRMRGKHIRDYYEKDSSRFSKLGEKVKNISEEFNSVIEKINSEYGKQ